MLALIKAGASDARPVRLEVWHPDEPDKRARWDLYSRRDAYDLLRRLENKSGRGYVLEDTTA